MQSSTASATATTATAPSAHKALAIQNSDSKIVELSGYVVIVVQSLDGKVKLFGSPADKDNLEVADEVLNVNERVLCDLPHAEVVRYLHECVRSCVIKLRVKRRSDARLSSELANSVQDAFVIAVEEQAKVRLQRLLDLQRVKPVDMSQLSMQLNQSKGNNALSGAHTGVASDFSFLREGSPIYVTSLSGQNVTTSGSSTKTTDSSVAFKPAASAGSQQQSNGTIINAQSHKQPQHNNTHNAPKEIAKATATAAAVNQHKPLVATGSQLSSSSTASIGSKTASINTINNNHIVPAAETAAPKTTTSNGSGAHPQTSFDSFFGNSAKSTPVAAAPEKQPPAAASALNGHASGGPAAREQLTTLSEVDIEQTNGDDRRKSVVCPVSISSGGAEVLLGEQNLRVQDNNRRRRCSGASILAGGDSDTTKAYLPSDEGEFISGPLNYSPLQQQQLYNAAGTMDVLAANNQDNGPYQEMAVDVPDSFIARNKTPPRYPPPQQMQLQSSHQYSHQLNSSVRPVPPPRDHLRIEQDGRLVNRAPAPQVPERNHPQHGSTIGSSLDNGAAGTLTTLAPTGSSPIAQVMAPTSEQLDTIKKYKDQLRRRHEEHNRVTQEHEFMRASLRESRKLQSLQNQRAPPVGVENSAYIDDDDDASTSAESANATTPTFEDVQTAILQLHYELNKCGLTGPANRIAMVQQLLASHDFAQALALREQVLQRRRTRNHNPVSLCAQELAKECCDSLAESNSPHAIELCDILASYEMEGLMLTHDAIANDTDSTADPNPARQLQRRASDAKQQLQQQQQQQQQQMQLQQQLLQQQQQQQALQQQQPNNVANMINNNGTLMHGKLPVVGPGGSGGIYHSGAALAQQTTATDPIRIIQIEKSTEPLGATILNEGEAVVIGRIVRGGAAEKSGLLHEKDEILEVNGIEMSSRNVNEVCALLAAMTGTLTFLIVPAAGSAAAATMPGPPPVPQNTRELHVRALFDYDPEDDRYIPCRELGISFTKGDVLRVISRDDSNWWQAHRDSEEEHTLAGLIPSQSFQHQREAMRLAAAGEAGLIMGGTGGRGPKGMMGGLGAGGAGAGGATKASTLLCMRKAGKGRKKRLKASGEAGYPLYATTTPDDPDPEEILTYEEVALYYPRESHKRPIVLIGPPNIGRHELRQRLIADSDRFAAAVPHTSRPRRDQEEDYHFISRVQFEADILSKKFVEHGEYERAYYGTSFEAIRTVATSGKICVINLHPQSLKLMRASGLMPYVVLVAPPSLEKLRQKKERNSEPLKDEDLKEIISTAREMESRFGHLFDSIIINNDTERAYHQLLAEINALEREPQWVPASWIN